MMMSRVILERRAARAAVLAAGLVGLLVLGGCGAMSPQQRVSQAQKDYQQHNYHAAEVQLKTVLRQHADNGKAWILLGNTSMAKRQYDDAIYQFHKARSAGVPETKLALPLGRALVADGQYKKALAELDKSSSTSDRRRAMVASLRGDAFAALNKPHKAAKAYGTALSINPKLPDALRGKARLAIVRGDLQQAKQALTKAVSVNAKDASSLSLLGQVDYRQNDCKNTIKQLSRALKFGSGGALTKSQFQTSRVIMADCQLRLGQAKAAQKNIQSVLSVNQSNPFGNYIQALLYIRRGEYQKAANHVQAILNVNPRNLRSMTLMAWIRIAQGQPDDAQPFLTRVLQQAPDNVAALRLQAGLWMAQNKDQQAQDLIEKAYKRHGNQPGARTALRQVMSELKQQNHKGSQTAKGLDEVALQLGLARSLAQMGSRSAADTILGKIKPKTPAQKKEFEQARVQIALAENDTADAISRAKRLVHDNPHDLSAKRLLAGSYIAAGQYDLADKTLAKAAQSNAHNTGLIQARAQLASRRGDYSKAIGLIKPLLEQHSRSVGLTLELAELYGRAGQDAKRIKLLKSATQSNSNSSRLNKALARAYLLGGKTDQAMSLIDKQLKTQGQDPVWLQLKGVAQLTKSQTDAGIKTLEQAADQAPDQPKFALAVAKAQLSNGRTGAAIKRLQKLRKQAPDYLPAAAFLALAQASVGHTKAALAQTDALRNNGHAFEANRLDGAILGQAKRYKQAAQAYAKAYQHKPSARLAVAMFNVRRQGHLDKPAQPLRHWLSRHPDDSSVALRLANWYQASGDNRQAAIFYKKVLAQHGNAVIALNNLAVIQTDSNPQQALSYARRAHSRAPKSPAISDTLGWVLVQNDQLDQGIPLLKQAEAKAGSASPEIRFHLGAALAQRAQSGDIAQARQLLSQALSAGLPDGEAKKAHAIIHRLGQKKTTG